MSAELLSILLDIVVLIVLGVTIYYALKLSKSLNNFRSYRREFDALIRELNRNIEHAYEAVRSMKESSTRSADDLDELYRQARQMGDELKLINATSSSLADRLEKLATQQGRGSAASSAVADQDNAFLKNVRHLERDADDGFMIRDPDFGADADEEDDIDDGQDFQSEAERDLYRALKQKNK